jgi:hypothetical protein
MGHVSLNADKGVSEIFHEGFGIGGGAVLAGLERE